MASVVVLCSGRRISDRCGKALGTVVFQVKGLSGSRIRIERRVAVMALDSEPRWNVS